MLGRLARWLRVLGFDAAYRCGAAGRPAADARRARGPHRADARRSGCAARAIARASSGSTATASATSCASSIACCRSAVSRERAARCVACNVAARAARRRSACPAAVPEYVRATQHDFKRCSRCRRIYWPATHRDAHGRRDRGARADAACAAAARRRWCLTRRARRWLSDAASLPAGPCARCEREVLAYRVRGEDGRCRAPTPACTATGRCGGSTWSPRVELASLGYGVEDPLRQGCGNGLRRRRLRRQAPGE